MYYTFDDHTAINTVYYTFLNTHNIFFFKLIHILQYQYHVLYFFMNDHTAINTVYYTFE